MLRELTTVAICIICVIKLIGYWRTQILIRICERYLVTRLLPSQASFCYNAGCISILYRLHGGGTITFIASGIKVSKLFPFQLKLGTLKLWLTLTASNLTSSPTPIVATERQPGKNVNLASFITGAISQLRANLEINEVQISAEFQPTITNPDEKQFTGFADIENHTKPWQCDLAIANLNATKMPSQLTISAERAIWKHNHLMVLGKGPSIEHRDGRSCGIKIHAVSIQACLNDLADTVLFYNRYRYEVSALKNMAKTTVVEKSIKIPEITQYALKEATPVVISLFTNDPAHECPLGRATIKTTIQGTLKIDLTTPCLSCHSWDPVKVPFLSYVWNAELSHTTVDGEWSDAELPDIFNTFRDHVRFRTGGSRTFPLLKHTNGVISVQILYDRWAQATAQTREGVQDDRMNNLGKYRQSILIKIGEKLELYSSYLSSGSDLYVWYLYYTQLYKCYRLNLKTREVRESLWRESLELSALVNERVNLYESAQWFNDERQQKITEYCRSFLSTWDVSRLLTSSVTSVSIEKAVLINIPVPNRLLGQKSLGAQVILDNLTKSTSSASNTTTPGEDEEDAFDSSELCIVQLKDIGIFICDAVGGSSVFVESFRLRTKPTNHPNRPTICRSQYSIIDEEFWGGCESSGYMAGTNIEIFCPRDYTRVDIVVNETYTKLNARTMEVFAHVSWSLTALLYCSSYYKDRSQAFKRIMHRPGVDQAIGLIIKKVKVELSPDNMMELFGVHYTKDKVLNNHYCRIDHAQAGQRGQISLGEVFNVQVWYVTHSSHVGGPTGNLMTLVEDSASASCLQTPVTDESATYYYTVECDIERKTLGIGLDDIRISVSDPNTLAYLTINAYITLYKAINIFVSPPLAIQRVFTALSRRTRPAFFLLTKQEYKIAKFSLVGGEHPGQWSKGHHSTSCPPMMTSRAQIYIPKTQQPQINGGDTPGFSDENFTRLLTPAVIGNPLLVKELKHVVTSLIDKLMGTGPAGICPGAKTRRARPVESRGRLLITLGKELHRLQLDGVTVRLEWQTRIRKAKLEVIEVSATCVHATSESHTSVKAHQVRLVSDSKSITFANIRLAEVVANSRDFITESFLHWLCEINSNFMRIARALIFPGPGTTDPRVQVNLAAEGSESEEASLSEVTTYRVSMVSAESDGFYLTEDDTLPSEQLPFVSSNHKSKPWLQLEACTVTIWDNAFCLAVPCPLELRELRTTYALDVRGTCAVKICGTTAMKLRAPSSVLFDSGAVGHIHRIKLKGLEINAYPSLTLAICQLGFALIDRFGQREPHEIPSSSAARSAMQLVVEEVEVEHVVIRLSPSLTISLKATRFLHNVTVSIGGLKALQAMPEAQANHLACLHANLSDIRWNLQNKDLRNPTKSTVVINTFAIHYVPALLSSCLQPTLLAIVLGLSVLQGVSRRRAHINSGSTPLLLDDPNCMSSPDLSAQIASFNIHIQETAFLTTRTPTKTSNGKERVRLLRCSTSKLTPSLGIETCSRNSTNSPRDSILPYATFDKCIEVSLLILIETEYRVPIPWHRTSSGSVLQHSMSTSPALGGPSSHSQFVYNNNATYGFTLEATEVLISRDFNTTASDDLLMDPPTMPIITLRVTDLNLKTRGSTTSLGRLDFEAVYSKSKYSLAVHKLLANLSRCQTLRLADLIEKTVHMASSLLKYSVCDPLDSERGLSNTASNVTDDDGWMRSCATPTLTMNEGMEPSAYRVISNSSRGLVPSTLPNNVASADIKSVKSSIKPVESQAVDYSLIDAPVTQEIVITIAQGSLAFLSGDVQLLRVLVSRLLLSRTTRLMLDNGAQCSEGKSKITTCANVTDLMLMTCSPLIADSGLVTPDVRVTGSSQTSSSSQPLVPLLAPLSDHDPLFSLVMTHHLYRCQRRTKSVGRRKRFISTIMGGSGNGGVKAHEPDAVTSTIPNGLGDSRCKRLFAHMESERIDQQTRCCHKYDNIDLKVAPIEVKMAQKLLVAIHDYFSGDPTNVVADKDEASPKTDLLESLKAVEQHIIQTSQSNPDVEGEQHLIKDETEFRANPTPAVTAATSARPRVTHGTSTSVEVSQVKIHPIRLLLSYHGLINIHDCQVSLNAFVLNNVEAPHINAVLKKIGLHIMTSAFAKALSFRVKSIVPRRKNSERKREKFAIARLMPKKRTADDLLAYILDEHKRRKSKWDEP